MKAVTYQLPEETLLMLKKYSKKTKQSRQKIVNEALLFLFGKLNK